MGTVWEILTCGIPMMNPTDTPTPTSNLAKRVFDNDGSDIAEEIPIRKPKKPCPTIASLPYHQRLIIEVGKRNLHIHVVTVKAWLASQNLDTSLTRAWLDVFDTPK
jgi:hypothetical protein